MSPSRPDAPTRTGPSRKAARAVVALCTVGTVAADNQIELQVTARVADVGVNAAISQLRNNATVSSDTFADVLASADVEIVEPNLTASKSGNLTSGQAGDVVSFTLDVGHSGSSSADARQVTITDTLPST